MLQAIPFSICQCLSRPGFPRSPPVGGCWLPLGPPMSTSGRLLAARILCTFFPGRFGRHALVSQFLQWMRPHYAMHLSGVLRIYYYLVSRHWGGIALFVSFCIHARNLGGESGVAQASVGGRSGIDVPVGSPNNSFAAFCRPRAASRVPAADCFEVKTSKCKVQANFLPV